MADAPVRPRHARLHRSILTMLYGVAIVACAGSTAQPPPDSTPRSTRTAGPPADAPFDAPRIAEEMFSRTNAARRAAGLIDLTRSDRLMQAAGLQARQMASAGRMSHELPDAAYPTLASRLAHVAYAVREAGENIAEGYRQGDDVVAGWLTSSGHRANILGAGYTELGTGVARARDGRRYFVQVFARPVPVHPSPAPGGDGRS